MLMQEINGKKLRYSKPQDIVILYLNLKFECRRRFHLLNDLLNTLFDLYVDHANVARLLIANGANVNAKDHLDNAPLHKAALNGKRSSTYKTQIS